MINQKLENKTIQTTMAVEVSGSLVLYKQKEENVYEFTMNYGNDYPCKNTTQACEIITEIVEAMLDESGGRWNSSENIALFDEDVFKATVEFSYGPSIEDEIELMNDIIANAIYHGSDGASYEHNREGLTEVMNEWLSEKGLNGQYVVRRGYVDSFPVLKFKKPSDPEEKRWK